MRKDPVCTGENKTGTMWRGTAAARLLLRACASSPVLQQHTQQLLPPLQSASRPAILLPVTRWIQTKAALRSHGGGGGGGGKLVVYVCFSPFSFPPFFDCHHFQTIDDVRYLFSPLSLAPHMPPLFCGKLLDDPSVAALFSSFSLRSCPIVGYICCLLAPASLRKCNTQF